MPVYFFFLPLACEIKNKIAPGWNLVPISIRADLVLQCFLTIVRQHIWILLPLAVPRYASPCFLVLWDLISDLLPPHENKPALICGFLHLSSLNSELHFSVPLFLALLSITLTSGCSLPQQAVEEQQHKDQWFQENQNQLSAEEEEDFLARCSETTFHIQILALRLNRYWGWLLE